MIKLIDQTLSIVLPTRGLIFTEVENAIEEIRQYGFGRVEVFRSIGLSIPDCHNQLTEEALAINPDYILFLEEDTVPPQGALLSMFRAMSGAKADISFIDYAVNGWACSVKDSEGNILWCGVGCTLVKADVFKKLEKPYFRNDKSLSLNQDTYFQWLDIPNKYGGQDIWFCCKAREAGFKIVQAEGECKHMRIDSLGIAGVNNGFHAISQKPTIINRSVYPLTFKDELDNNESIEINSQL